MSIFFYCYLQYNSQNWLKYWRNCRHQLGRKYHTQENRNKNDFGETLFSSTYSIISILNLISLGEFFLADSGKCLLRFFFNYFNRTNRTSKDEFANFLSMQKLMVVAQWAKIRKKVQFRKAILEK